MKKISKNRGGPDNSIYLLIAGIVLLCIHDWLQHDEAGLKTTNDDEDSPLSPNSTPLAA